MAINSCKKLRNLVIYQVFPRQHSTRSDFFGVTKDLERIKKLGVDIIYLLPIFEIGQKNKKGSLGCPYSIKDYYTIDPNLGTIDDFKRLVSKAHSLGMKVIIDMVVNHTSRDSRLLDMSKDNFYLKNGMPANKVGDWTDVCDLDYNNDFVHKYIIDMLYNWSKFVDGYRIDVCSLVPLKLWIDVRDKILYNNKDFIFIGESVEYYFIYLLRKQGFTALSDSELYQAFDILYEYDIFHSLREFIKTWDKKHLDKYLLDLKNQDFTFPDNYTKLRFLDNHDVERVAKYVTDFNKLINLYMFSFFRKGANLIYAGDEYMDKNLPSLFDIDPTNYDGLDISKYLKKMIEIHKNEIIQNGYIHILENDNCLILKYEYKNKILIGYFNLYDNKLKYRSHLKKDKYINLFTNEEIEIDNYILSDMPIIIETEDENEIFY